LVDYNPQSYNRATSQSTWTSATGEVWTLNTAATNNALKAAIVDRTMIMGNGTTYGMRAASLSINQAAITQYNVIRKFVNTAGGQLITELGDASVQNNAIAFAINDTAGVNSVNNSTPFTFVAYYTGNSTSLLLHTVVYDGQAASPKSKYLENNILKSVNSTFGTFGNSNINQTGYNLLARNNAAGAWANVIFCGDLVFSGEDNATVQTAMYNAIKTFTNGI
jgi:stage V sporulation protein SpoVS